MKVDQVYTTQLKRIRNNYNFSSLIRIFTCDLNRHEIFVYTWFNILFQRPDVLPMDRKRGFHPIHRYS